MAQLPSAHSLAAAPPKRSLPWLWVLLATACPAAHRRPVVHEPEPVAVGRLVGIVATETVEATSASRRARRTDHGAVPNVVGMSQKDAEAALEDAGFAPLATKVTTNDTPAGDVVAQVPAADTELTPGSQVAIQVAQAKEPEKPTTVKVPNVVGMTQANAQSALVDAGLAPSFVNQANDAPKGQAFEQQPASGGSVAPETVVIVAISTGPAASAGADDGLRSGSDRQDAGRRREGADRREAHLAGRAVLQRDRREGDRGPAVATGWQQGRTGHARGAGRLAGARSPPTARVTVPNVKGMDADGAPPRRSPTWASSLRWFRSTTPTPHPA